MHALCTETNNSVSPGKSNRNWIWFIRYCYRWFGISVSRMYFWSWRYRHVCMLCLKHELIEINAKYAFSIDSILQTTHHPSEWVTIYHFTKSTPFPTLHSQGSSCHFRNFHTRNHINILILFVQRSMIELNLYKMLHLCTNQTTNHSTSKRNKHISPSRHTNPNYLLW